MIINYKTNQTGHLIGIRIYLHTTLQTSQVLSRPLRAVGKTVSPTHTHWM